MKRNFSSPPPLSHGGLTHIPVLYNEVLTALDPQPNGSYLDGTLGMAGHAWGILSASFPNGTLLAIDQDPTSINIAKKRLQDFSGRWQIIHSNFANLKKIIKNQKLNPLPGNGMYDGILLDLGFSSLQMDNAQRGFSFHADTPLDMRLDPTKPLTAADLVNTLAEAELANLIYKYGEEHKSRRIAKEIIRHRPFHSAKALGDLITKVLTNKKRTGKTRSRIHPATKTFQALRIAVNHELDVLETVLPDAISQLKSGGKLAVITFHSLEDRIVKHYFRQETIDCLCPSQILFCRCNHKATLDRRQTTRKPILPMAQEIKNNPRARSAKLRIAVRL